MTDLLDSGRNVIPALPKVRRRGARSNDWSCSRRIKEPSPVRGTSTWNSNTGIGRCQRIFIGDPCLCLSGGYEPLKFILICGNAYFSWIRAQHFQQIPKGVSEPPKAKAPQTPRWSRLAVPTSMGNAQPDTISRGGENSWSGPSLSIAGIPLPVYSLTSSLP